MFRDRLVRALRERGYSQGYLARALGVSQGLISFYCSGREQPGLTNFLNICRVLNISADWLLGLSDDEQF